MMQVFEKLVRDRIPEIMENAGERPVIRVLEEAEYLSCLQKKLTEEVEEYLESGALEELADILEVVSALAAAQGSSAEALHQAAQKKREARGGFSQRIYLIGKE